MGAGDRAVCAEAPSARLSPRAFPAGAASPAGPCVHTRARARTPACTRRPRAPAARTLVGSRPSLLPSAPGHLLPQRGGPHPAPDSSWDFRSPGRVSQGHVPASWHPGRSCCCSAPAELRRFTPRLCVLLLFWQGVPTLASLALLPGPSFCASV